MSRIAEPSSSESQAQKQQQPGRQHSKLVQRLLDASASLPNFVNDLLTTQAVVVAGTEAAAFIVERKGEELGLRLIAHIRPDESDAETRAAAVRAFQGIIAPCVQQTKDGAIEVGSPDGGEPQYCLVTILRSEGEVVAVSAVITRCRDQDRAKQRLTSMQLVAGYFELYSLRRAVEQSRLISDQHQRVLQYAGAIATGEGFEASAMSLCNELATRTGATRVSLGWVKGKTIKVRALSHTEKFDKKQELVVQLQKVMEECLDQEEPVRYDPSGACSQNVTREAKTLSEQQHGNIVLSMPLRRRDELAGVLTLEFASGFPLDEQAENGISTAAELLAPQLFDRYENDRYIWIKMGHSLRDLVKHAVGPKYWTAKLVILGVIALGLFIGLYKPMYHVRCPIVVKSLDNMTLCAPYEGILQDVYVKPGQMVKAGQVIGRLKTDDWQEKYADAVAEADSKAQDAQQARAQGKLAEAKAKEFDAQAARARAKLMKFYLDRAELKSPIEGVLVSRDLTERKGMPVNKGDPLFEIAKATVDANGKVQVTVEAELQPTDRDIQEVDRIFAMRQAKQNVPSGLGYDGEMSTTSYPNLDHKFLITRIVPMGEPKEGENAFKVYATIENPPDWMHPGLAGEARVNIEKKPLYWIWTHRLVDWMRLKFWLFPTSL